MRRSQPTQTYVLSKNQSHFGLGLLVMMLSIFLLSSTILNANNNHNTDNLESNFETTLEDLTDCQSISFKDYHVVDPTCGNNDGTISFRVNNPNNYCLVYRLYNYNTDSWATGFQTSKIFTGLPVAQYRVKMYVDHNCDVNNPSTDCYTPSDYMTLTCTTCAPQFTVNNTGDDAARLLWWKNTGDEDVTVIQPGTSHTLAARDGAMFRVINTDTDWSNLLYDEHITVDGCSNQSWNIAPKYSSISIIETYSVANTISKCTNGGAGESAAFYQKDCNNSFIFWKAESDLKFYEYSDNTARMQGHINDNGSQGYVDIHFTDKSATGPIYDNDCYTSHLSGSESHYNTFNGTITVGTTVYTINTRNNMSAHLTNGAGNDGNSTFGMAAWSGGTWGSCGEIFLNLLPVSNCTGDISSIVLKNDSWEQPLTDTWSYKICELPTNGYLEAVVSGSHQSFKFTVDGFDRTENVEPYNYPNVSNGENWNPQVGVHNITGTLYSQDGLGGEICDEVTIQIIVESCQATETCDNFTDGGVISSDQTICPGESFSPQNVTSPSGGSGSTEYLWIYNHAGPTTDGSSNYSNSNTLNYTIQSINQTVWVRRCARRANCNPYEGESNWIKITVDNNACNNTCTGDISSIVLKNDSWDQPLTDTWSYKICELPTNGYLEAVVSGSHQSFKFTVDGTDRTENVEPYNYPNVSNGENWNPQVGVHNITGTLYSQDGLGGEVCDEVTIQIIISECEPANIIKTCDLDDHGYGTFNTSEERLIYMSIDNVITEYFVNGPSTITEYSDGSAIISGTAEQVDNTCNKWEYNVKLTNKRTWSEWSALGRTYKDHENGQTLDYASLSYYELDNNNSTFTGTNCLSGKTLNLTHAPSDFNYGFQIGVGGNVKDLDFGLSGWFSFTGSYTGNGDFNGDVNCGTTNQDGCTSDNLLALYDFKEGSGNTINDISGVGTPLNLTIANTNNVSWLSGQEGLSIDNATIIKSSNPATKINQAVKNTNEITIEAWVRPALNSQSGPARIVSISDNTADRNMTLGQEGSKFVQRLRTTSTSNNGIPEFYSNTTVNTGVLQHVVYTKKANGDERFYINGVLDATGNRPSHTTNWDDNYMLSLGNEITNDRPWLGQFCKVAIYSAAFESNEVIQNYESGCNCSSVLTSIGDKVFEDTNGNGIQDTGEPGVDGVTVMLLYANGNMVGQTTTTGGGLYGFGDVPAGDYKIKFTTPNGYEFTNPNKGNDDSKDSDATPMAGTNDGMSEVFTVNGSDDISNIDAGIYVPVKLGNKVFEDTNGNGIQDTGEPGIDGVTITLVNFEGTTVGTTTTANGGLYEFTGLTPGDYKVIFPQAATTNSGVTADLTAPNQGGDDTKDSDANLTDGTTNTIFLASGDDNQTIDAGYIGKATIGNLVFEDTNGNGIQDANEPGIDGVTVMLLDANGNMVGQTTTTGGGLYEFADVAPGDYKIKFTTPNGYEFTNPNKGNDESKDSDATPMAGTNDGMTEVFTVNGGDDISNIDAGIYVPVKLGNKVFEDTNGNGIQDTNEPGIDGVTITLVNFEGTTVGTTTTANGGLYEFTGLTPGDYKVIFPQVATTNSGVTADLTAPNQGGDDTKDSDANITDGATNTIFLASGDDNQTIDAGYIPGVASIGNKVFEDTNGNGIQDTDEPGIAGVTVMLLDANGNMVGQSTTTNATGFYDFTDLAPGTYKVKFTAPTQNGVTADVTKSNQGTQEGKDSDAIEMPGTNDAMTDPITVEAGDDKNNVDAGYFFPAKLGDKVFEDTNGNGIQDTNEPGIDGVTVMLIDGSGSIAGTTTTANGGLYEFTGLAPDVYKVKFPQSATTNSNVAADLTTPNQGGDDTKDSDATPIAGTTDAESQVVTIESGDDLNTIDAGYIPAKASIGDIVFEDKNGNGIQDNNEPGIDGVTVMLLDANGNMVSGVPAQTTSGGGEYSFTNLPAGTYKVKFTAPTQNGVTAQITDVNVGGDDTKDSDAVGMPNSNDAMTAPITVNGGDDNNDVDAGFYFPAKIGNYVWADKNNNGIQEADEPAFDGVTVMLLDGNGNPTGQSTTTANGGFYEFAGLAPGDYQVKFPTQATTPGGAIADLVAADQGGDDAKDSDATPIAGTSDAVSPIITLQSGDNNETIDAGYYDEKIPPASIGDIVFEDKNGNGIQDNNEPGIDGVTVMLLDENGNMVGQPTTTSGGGEYSFTDLVPGTYKVKFTAPTQNGVTAQITDVNVGGDDSKDSDAVEMPNSNDAMTAPITVSGGDNISNVDAGYYFLASIGNYVWEDTNLNGIQDFGEAGIPGVPVELRDGNGNPTGQTTTTDNDGLYSFRELTPGDYKVVFPTTTTVNNANLILTASDLGGNDAADSDAIAMAVINEAMSPVVTLESGDNNDSIDAGYFETATIGDRVFNDQNQNGLQDNGDTNIPGVTVMLIGTDAFGNDVNQTLVTDNNGEYLFTNVVPGTYEVKFTTPTTLVITEKDTQGNGFDFGDSDIDPLTGKTAPFTVTSGDDNRDIDAGFFLDPALPVALTSFEAQLVNNSEVILKWATASEEDNSHFIVERSADGRDFEAIGTVAGNGTTNQVNKYSLVDKDPYYGYNYYRLKQVDFDGDYEFSQIETVIISSQDVPDVIIYPNPVMTTTTLRVVTPFETDAQVEIVDQTGKVVLNVTMAKGANSKQLDMSKFAAGMYFAYVNYNGHRQLVHKIVKVEE